MSERTPAPNQSSSVEKLELGNILLVAMVRTLIEESYLSPTHFDFRRIIQANYPFGKSVQLVRAARGLSRKELAQMATLSPSQIWRIETLNSDPLHDTMLSISEALKVPLDALLGKRTGVLGG